MFVFRFCYISYAHIVYLKCRLYILNNILNIKATFWPYTQKYSFAQNHNIKCYIGFGLFFDGRIRVFMTFGFKSGFIFSLGGRIRVQVNLYPEPCSVIGVVARAP